LLNENDEADTLYSIFGLFRDLLCCGRIMEGMFSN